MSETISTYTPLDFVCTPGGRRTCFLEEVQANMAAARRLAMEARRSMADTRDLELQHRLEALAASQEAEIERLVDVSRDTNPCEGCPALIG